MLVNKKLSQEIYNDAGETRISKAKRYVKEGKVNITKSDYENENNFSLTSIVSGNFDDYKVNIEIKKGELEIASCECQDYKNYYSACKHIVATLIKFEQTKYWDNEYKQVENVSSRQKNPNERFKYKSFSNLINSFYNEELQEIKSNELIRLSEKDRIKIEAKIDYDKFSNGMKLEIKIGKGRMYKIKDLPEFYTRMVNNEYFKYGEKLEFVHTRENFEEGSKPLLDFILRYAEIMKYSNSSDKYGYYYSSSINKAEITLGEGVIDEVFDLLKDKKVSFNYDYSTTRMEFIEENPQIEFDLSKINDDELLLFPNIDVFRIAIFKGKKYNYLLYTNKLYRCDEKFSNTTLKVIKVFRENYTSEMLLRKEDLKDFYSIIMPKIENSIKVKGLTEEDIEKYRPEKLAVKVFLDFDENNFLIADVKFCYADEEFNPLDENVKIKALRNELEENRNLNILNKSGFMLDVKNMRFILPNDEQIYEFLSNDINYYMQKFEVLVTENFKTKEIREPRLGSVGVKVENDLLNIDLSKLNISPEEIQDVMEKYKLRCRIFRQTCIRNGYKL